MPICRDWFSRINERQSDVDLHLRIGARRIGQSISASEFPSREHLQVKGVSSASMSFSMVSTENNRRPRSVMVCSTRGILSSNSCLVIMPDAWSALRRSCSDFMLRPGMTLRKRLVRTGPIASSLRICTVHLALIKFKTDVIGQARSLSFRGAVFIVLCNQEESHLVCYIRPRCVSTRMMIRSNHVECEKYDS